MSSPGRAWPSSFRGGLPVDPYIPMVPDMPIGTDAPPRVTPPPARWLQYNRLQYNRVHVLFQGCWPACLAFVCLASPRTATAVANPRQPVLPETSVEESVADNMELARSCN